MPSYVDTFYITAVGGGGAGSIGFQNTILEPDPPFFIIYSVGGYGGGSGGAIYKYKVNYLYNSKFDIIVGNGSVTSSRPSSETNISYIIKKNTNNYSKIIRCGGGGDAIINFFKPGAGGSVSFNKSDSITTNNVFPPPINSSSPFLAGSIASCCK